MESTHIANPVRVTAVRILDVTDITNREPGCGQSSPDLMLRLEDGTNFEADMSMTSRYVPAPGDYVVTQEDGYVYLNPKDVFERKYRPIAPLLDFADALRAMKEGKKVARAGWNGKGMWIARGDGSPANPAEKFWNPHARKFAEENGGAAPVLPYILMKTATGEILMGWLASQTDMLAEDWVILS